MSCVCLYVRALVSIEVPDDTLNITRHIMYCECLGLVPLWDVTVYPKTNHTCIYNVDVSVHSYNYTSSINILLFFYTYMYPT